MAGREQPVWVGVPGYPGGGSDWLLAVRGGGSSCAALRRLGHARHTGNHKENRMKGVQGHVVFVLLILGRACLMYNRYYEWCAQERKEIGIKGP